MQSYRAKLRTWKAQTGTEHPEARRRISKENLGGGRLTEAKIEAVTLRTEGWEGGCYWINSGLASWRGLSEPT